MRYETKNLFTPLLGRVGNVLLLLAVLGLAASCGKKSGDEKVSQSIVRVNGDEITVLQLNNELQRANVQPAQQEIAGKQITSALVDRQILMQEAHKNKLDRNPGVMQAIENAKSQILAQAYLEDKASSVAKPTDAEINDYRSKHADIFAGRKVFVMEEVAFKVNASNIAGIQSLSNTAKTLEDVTKWLDGHQIKYALTRASHATETVPPQVLDKLEKMVVGDIIFINANDGSVAGRMVEIKDSAISEADAKPIIERIIFEKKLKQFAENEVKRLRNVAKIEYINKKFEPAFMDSEAKTVDSASATKPAGTEKVIESTKSVYKSKVESHVENGLSGL